MTLIEAMQELLSCKMVDGKTALHAILTESDPSAKLQKITLSELAPGMLVLYIDNGRKVLYRSGKQHKTVAVCMSPLFSTTNGKDHNCGCDAVLIHVPDENDTRCEIFYIELKSDTPYGYAGQFVSTMCFLQYVKIVIQEFWDAEMLITRERYIVFHTDTQNFQPKLGKRTTRPDPKNANSPEKPDMHIVRDRMTIRCTELF